jgi:hypothetical protein
MKYAKLSRALHRPISAPRNLLRRLLFEPLETRRVMATTPIISEILASNSDGLRDSDGESSDWIELYNPTSTSVNLSGWRLIDNPSDLNQWTLPAVTIGANEYLTVFASGKDRAVAGQELHTNFRLASAGDFLALVNPSGTIVSQFSPMYPQQATNISYGPRFENQTFVTTGSNAKTLIPTNNTLGSTWLSPTFNDATWATTPVGVGFGVVEPGFDVTYYKTNVDLEDLSTALNVIATPSLQTNVVQTREQVINYLGNGSGANFGNDIAFATQEVGDDINNFAIQATSTITIPTAGNWTFGVNSDDGFRLTLNRNGTNYISEFPGLRGPADTLTTFNLPAGTYSATLVMFERGGGASVELFAAAGTHTAFNSNFDLVGDVTNGGIAANIVVPAGPNSPLRTDIGSSMRNINASSYIRLPFNVTNPTSIDSLQLRMRYDDGFVAYLNGVEIARRNAPTTPSFNSSALTDRTAIESIAIEEINVSAFRTALVSGNNVLAIQGMNSSASDSSFLILPELVGSQLFENELRYFSVVTPGGPNQGAALGIVNRPTFSVPAGFYDTTQTVAITVASPAPGTIIRYTLDGSEPTETNGTIYTSSLVVSQTSTIRAFAYAPDYVSLPSSTSSYLYVNDIINQAANGVAPAGWPSSWGNNVVDYGMDPDVIALEGAQTVRNALKAIPTINISTDLANLFDANSGIYSNAYNDGRDWERPASFEVINPDGSAGAQANAGLRIRGGYSRSPDNPKHSFRLFFRGEYGDSTLEYPIAGPGLASSFKKIDLRTAQNYSWSFGGDGSNNFVTDVYNRLSQQAMGMPSTSGSWYHLYLNGMYWGLYETQERSEAEFASTYFGGLATNYDVVKAEAGPYTIFATDGNLDAWYRLWDVMQQNIASTTTPIVSNNVEYLKLQGKNPDGTDNPSYEVLLDVDNLAVYMIGILYGGNLDAPISNFLGNTRVNNFYAMRDRTSREGFKYFLHDSEHTLRNVNENRNGPWPAGSDFNYSNPQWFHQRLMSNAEYRMRFADLVQKYFFYEGALAVATSQTRFQSEASAIDQAIYAESARWGDAKRPSDPLRRQDWVNAVNGVVGGYFPIRNGIVITQFRNTTLDGSTIARLFPTIDAPTFLVNGTNQHGGIVAPNSTLRFGSAAGTVYYTTDGSDPRLFGGAVNPASQSYSVSTTTDTIFGTGSTWRYRDTGIDLGSSWRSNSYNDTSWSSGVGEFGYGDGDEATVISFGPNANNKYITSYFRKSFNLSNVADITALTLQLRRDDGAVIYINGVEAARSNMATGSVTASTLAASAVGGTDESTLYSFELNPGLLQNGNNVIAIEIHQATVNSSDLSFDASLTVTRQTSPSINMGVVPQSYKVRTLSSTGEWSALEQATFSVTLTPASSANLIVTEAHYNPQAYTGPNATSAPFNDAQNFEFLELRNTSNEVILLDGVSTVGITYTFPSSTSGPVTWLLPGQSIVIVKNQLAFAARYLQPGSPYLNIKIAPGDYGTSNLSNGGEAITINAANTQLIQTFTYDDDAATNWPLSPDGQGPSLTAIFMNPSLYNNASNWRASFVAHGTPGIEENDAPRSISLSNSSVDENTVSALVGSLATLDPDLFESFTYTIQGAAASFFTINGSELRVGTTALDFEAASQYVFSVTSTDAGGLSVTQDVTVTINNLNDAPVVNAGGPYSIGEGQSLNLVGSATDQDVGQTLVYEWDLDYDGVSFQVNVNGASPSVSFPDQGARTIALRVRDNGSPERSTIATSTVNVSNVNPTLTRNQATLAGDVLTVFSNSGTWSDVAADTVTLVASHGAVTKNVDGTWSWTYRPSTKLVAQTVTVTASDEDGGSSQVSFVIDAQVVVTEQYIFYKDSAFHNLFGINAALDSSRDFQTPSAAVQELLDFSNITNYTRGLNGLAFDIAGLVSTTLTTSDFIFRVAPFGVSGVSDPSSWTTTSPTVIHVTPGNATNPARVRLEWSNETAVKDTWMQIIIRPTANTGLAAPVVYYIGNVIAEVNEVAPFRITSQDVARIKQRVSGSLVPITDMIDINKDRRVTGAGDVPAAQSRVNGAIVLRSIRVPFAGSVNEGSNPPPPPPIMASLIVGNATPSITSPRSVLESSIAVPTTIPTMVRSAAPTSSNAYAIDQAMQSLSYMQSQLSTASKTVAKSASPETVEAGLRFASVNRSN